MCSNHQMKEWMDFSHYKPLTSQDCNLIPKAYFQQYEAYFTGYSSNRFTIHGDMVYFYQMIEPDKNYGRVPPNVLLNGMNRENNNVQGKFKDENAGIPLVEYCGLKPKCYSMLDVNSIPTMKAKGIPKTALKNQFNMEMYKN